MTWASPTLLLALVSSELRPQRFPCSSLLVALACIAMLLACHWIGCMWFFILEDELRSKPGVEVLDTSSMTDHLVHGNVLSGDGTHVWGFVDVMKAKLILSALCSV